LDLLETTPIDTEAESVDMRFPVQVVIRPTLDFRGYAGQIASGTIRRGDDVLVLPSGRTSRVQSIVTFDGELEAAHAPQSVTITLEHEIDISRGDMLVSPGRMPHASRRFEAEVVWMSPEPLQPDKPYLVKHTTQQVPATVTAIAHRTDVNTLARTAATQLELNEIGSVSVETRKPLYFDAYRRNRNTGCFIFIDPLSNLTLGAGMILDVQQADNRRQKALLDGIEFERSRLTAAERWERAGHRPVTVWLTARLELAYALERELFERGCMVHVLADEVESHLLPDLAHISHRAGLITICSAASDSPEDRERAKKLVGENAFVEVDPVSLPAQDQAATAFITSALEIRGIIRRDERGLDGDAI
ncbi:MAG TPA: hypothetical protein VES20_17745, partial [Bryobacteraceae bacterium]|nr:hypothetical protein [Bryobacteraceae bacterium]